MKQKFLVNYYKMHSKCTAKFQDFCSRKCYSVVLVHLTFMNDVNIFVYVSTMVNTFPISISEYW